MVREPQAYSVPPPTGQQHHAGGGGGQQQRAEHIEPGPDGGFGEFQYDGDDGQRDQSERDVDVEAPAPGRVVGEEAAEQRSGDGRETEGGADQPHETAALAGRYDVRDDRLDPDHEPAAADALDGTEGDQLVHGPGPAGQRGADDEDDDGELEDALAAEEIAEFAVDRQPDGGGEEIGGDGPGHLLQAVQLTDDLRQGGGDDHLVERREQQGEHQSEEDQPDPAGADLRGVGTRWGRGRSHRTGQGGGLHTVRIRGRRLDLALRTVRLVLHQSDSTRHVPLPSSHLRRPFLALHDKGGQTQRGAPTAHSGGLSPGGSHYGAQPTGRENHPNQ
ncbi:hypothetical protein GCM10018966_019340 [Streptomyces yanii]